MGSDLYRMIRDGHPPGWTAPMVQPAQAIADDARDPRQGSPGDDGWPWSAIPVRGHWDSRGRWRDGLTERTGLSERSISRALADLAAAGYEMREAVGTGKDGRPVFAAKGHALRFRVPRLPPRPVPECSPRTGGISVQSPPDSGGYESLDTAIPDGQSPPDRTPKPAKSASKPAILASPSPQSHPNSPPSAKSSAVNGPLEGSQGAREQDQDFSDSGEDPKAAADLAYKIVRSLPREAAAEVHATVAAMLLGRIGAEHIEAVLPAWLRSGKPPGALPEFVEPPAEAETAP